MAGSDPKTTNAPNLGENCNWMVYSHQQLYDMIHTGVDLQSASTAQVNWDGIRKALVEVQDLLKEAVVKSTRAWQGKAAEDARIALASVEKWAMTTGDHADNVAKCIGSEIEHVQTARRLMPAPVPTPPVVTPVDGISQVKQVDQARALNPATDARSPFTGADTIAGPVVDSVVEADSAHRQAADVMAMFQQNSYEVDRTVPSFAAPPEPPTSGPRPTPPVGVGPIQQPGSGGGGDVVPPKPGHPDVPSGTTTAQTGRGSGGFGGGAGGGGGYGGHLPSPLAAFGGGGGAAGDVGFTPGVGGSTGALADRPPAHPGSTTSHFQSPKTVTPHAGMIGATPMAAPPPVAGGNSEDRDRNRPDYLEEEDNVFGVDRKAAPPVIGL
ncbi:hypothetical protein GCM10022243_64550 [Saccharothrix violaceirubra]|uniref:PPE domain-containing protein n=1 Tax=Saccharothrix violaceirubra TaxID=413306 RepID=A0A7W7T9J3_9PSEU|nr:PPE domain-containing protein [Saccharothrix violaceirubra]MBB4969059.1 hypothetical protein [Saccharothrix violaceirubra]